MSFFGERVSVFFLTLTSLNIKNCNRSPLPLFVLVVNNLQSNISPGGLNHRYLEQRIRLKGIKQIIFISVLSIERIKNVAYKSFEEMQVKDTRPV